MRRALILLSLATLAVGCSAPGDDDDAGPVDMRVAIPAAPAAGEGVQIVMSELVVPAGQELMWCQVADWSPTEDVYVNTFEGFQAPEGGHHLVALGSQVPYEPGYGFDCTNIESMSTLSPLVLPTLDSVQTFPDGLAVKVAPGQSIVIQSHYINYTTEDMLVRDVVNLGFVDGSTVTEASYLILNHGGLDLAPGEVSAEVSCTLPGDAEYEVVSLLGHMHEYGVSMSVDLQPGAAGDWTNLYDIPDWDVDFRDLPPVLEWDTATPMTLSGGDRLAVNCNYDNVTGEPIRFPKEMCTSVLMYYPADERGLVICDEDNAAVD